MSTLSLWRRRPFGLINLVFLGLILISTLTTAASEDIVVAIHSGEHMPSKLSRNTLQAIFGMRIHSWPDGTAVKVFVLPDNHPTHIAFCKQILRVFPHEMRSAWDRLVFSGTGQAPTEVESEEIMRVKLAQTPGAIGYLGKTSSSAGIFALSVE